MAVTDLRVMDAQGWRSGHADASPACDALLHPLFRAIPLSRNAGGLTRPRPAFSLKGLNLRAFTFGPSGGCRIVHHPTKFTPALFSLVEDAPTVDGDGFRGVGALYERPPRAEGAAGAGTLYRLAQHRTKTDGISRRNVGFLNKGSRWNDGACGSELNACSYYESA